MPPVVGSGTLRIRTQTMLLSTVPVVFLLILLALALLMQQITTANAAFSTRASQTLQQSARVRETLEQASRSLTAFAGNHDQRSLSGYFTAAREMPGELTQLRQLASTPALKAAATRLSLTVDRGMQLLATYYRLETTGRLRQARALENNPSTQALAIELQAEIAAFENVARESSIQHSNVARGLAWRYEIALIVCSIAGILSLLYMTVRFGLSIVWRLNRLAQNARRLGEGQSTEPIEGNDEIAELDRVYHVMTRRIQREHAVASMLQSALLPQEVPDVPGLSIDTSYVPAAEQSEVGGDWYDVFVLSPGCVGISIGDVAGHGLHAATIMGSARQAIRMAAYVDSDPSSVFDKVNRLACAGTDKTLVTAFFATLDTNTGMLRYAVAGHPMPLLVAPTTEVTSLAGQGLMLGIDAQAPFETFALQLEPRSALLLFTDGLVESGRDYFKGMERLTQVFRSEYLRGTEHVAQALQETLVSDEQRTDDAAILYVRVDELGVALTPQRFHWEFDARDEESSKRIRRALLWHLGNGSTDKSRLATAEMVYGELVGNVARHTPGPAEMTLELRNGTATIQICDRGQPFTLRQIPPDILDEGGRGLLIVRALSNDVVVERHDHGNCVRAVFPVT